MLELTPLTTYLGPSPRADEPVVTAEVVLTDAARFQAAATRLTALCAEWFTPPEDSAEDPGLAAGEFIARWTRDMLNQQDGRIIDAGAARDDSRAVILHLGYHRPETSLQALNLCIGLLAEADHLDEDSVKDRLARFAKQTWLARPDFQAAILIEYARRHSIPFRRVEGGGRFWQFGWGARGSVMFESKPMSDSSLGANWATNKAFSKRIFRDLGAPVAASIVVRDAQELPKAEQDIGFPCVAKPLGSSRSVGVTTYIRSPEALRDAFNRASQKSRSGVMIERQIEGELIRIMVMRGRFWRAIRRNRPSIVADGRSTASELLAAFNRSRITPDSPSFVGPAPDDEEFRAALAEQDLAPDDIPVAGRTVRLRNIPLLATGAHYDDVTDILHPETRDMAEGLARYFRIAACGLDFIITDPAQSCHQQGGFLELNAVPGLRVPILAGVPEDEVCRIVLGDDIGRVPSLLVVAAAEAREEIRRLLPADNTLGWASGERAGLGSTTLSGRQLTVHASTRIVLRHPLVRSVVVIATAAEIEDRGLPLDRVDRAIVMPGAGLDDTWAAVLRRRAGAYEETDDLARIGDALPCAAGQPEPCST